jgi:ABC-type transporter Mla subunit MlaD
MIAEAAYVRAERRGFVGGDPLADWLDAEAEVDARLKSAPEPGVADRLEEQFSAATAKLKEIGEEIAGLKAEARERWQEDLAEVRRVRGLLRKRLQRLQQQGRKASEQTRQEAERVAGEFSEMVHDIGHRLTSAGRGASARTKQKRRR